MKKTLCIVIFISLLTVSSIAAASSLEEKVTRKILIEINWDEELQIIILQYLAVTLYFDGSDQYIKPSRFFYQFYAKDMKYSDWTEENIRGFIQEHRKEEVFYSDMINGHKYSIYKDISYLDIEEIENAIETYTDELIIEVNDNYINPPPPQVPEQFYFPFHKIVILFFMTYIVFQLRKSYIFYKKEMT